MHSPKEEPNLCLPLEHEYPGGRETQRVLRAVLAKHSVRVHAVHLKRLGLVQERQLGLGWGQTAGKRKKDICIT